MLNTDTHGYQIQNFTEFNREISPTVPKEFPKKNLPKELCANSLTEMYLCTMNSAENMCGTQAKNYYICKRERDAQIFSAIKSWETDLVTKMKKPQHQESYIDNLKHEKGKLEGIYERTQISIGNNHKRWRI